MWVLDATSVNCPLPVLRAQACMTRLDAGDVLLLLATDHGSLRDVPAFARRKGHLLLRQESAQGVHKYWLRKTIERKAAGSEDPGGFEGEVGS